MEEATSAQQQLAASRDMVRGWGGRVNVRMAEMRAAMRAEVDSLKQEKEAAVSHLTNELAQKAQETQQIQVSLCCRSVGLSGVVSACCLGVTVNES